ncbi:TMEM175 family protein [Mucilaginibacter sp. PAMB04168]|uniref:TMEM175 family protein n=1 Tax=Mucilaginibacter sp. PAMB04168 TaxID=3138567 RepID=UPI0031F70AF4
MKEVKGMNMKVDSTPERIYAFSDGVFAIIITIMILELKKPEEPTFEALSHLWPTWISYGASYIFIAIVWINHHYLLRHAKAATLKLMWANFAHLFTVSLIPFLTEWVADTKLQPVPVIMYAFDFSLVNCTYLWLVWETLCNTMDRSGPNATHRLLHMRSFTTLGIFCFATIISYWFPRFGFGLVVCCLLLYLTPELSKVTNLKPLIKKAS